MQIYNERHYPDYNQVKLELLTFQRNICKSKTIYQFYLDKYIKNFNDGYYGTWEIFYNQYLYKIMEYLKYVHKNTMLKCKIIKNKLIIKKFIRNNLYHYLYKPKGIRYKKIQNHFNLSFSIKCS